MERIGGFLVCTVCKKNFFTKLGFQIHTTEEHQQEESSLEARKTFPERSSKSNEPDKSVPIIGHRTQITEHQHEESSLEVRKTLPKKSSRSDKTDNLIPIKRTVEDSFKTQANSANSNNKKIIITNEPVDDVNQVNTFSSKNKDLTNTHEITETEVSPKKKLNGKSNYKIQCEICQNELNRNEIEGTTHLEIGHEQNQQLKCNNCNQSNNFEQGLKGPIKLVHEKTKSYHCRLCPKTYILNCLLKNHKLKVHDKIQNFFCPICQKGFFYEIDQLQHVKSVHEKIKPFQCKMCSKSFSQSINLKTHKLAVHEKFKRNCNFCPKGFFYKRDLLQHIRGVHEKMKP
jgi:hypothetical protein